jgi:hypothetical protein
MAAREAIELDDRKGHNQFVSVLGHDERDSFRNLRSMVSAVTKHNHRAATIPV